jgi:hypothetical protein
VLFTFSLIRSSDTQLVVSLYRTLIERKSRMPQIQGSKGEAVVVYRESLLTKEMVYHGLSQRVNKMGSCQESISHSQMS